MARISASNWLGRLRPRFPLEMMAASLATFLATAVWFDLPHRWQADGAAPAPAPQAEKLALQAPPLPIRMFKPSEEHEASAFMEAVALSHVGPLRPQGEVDRAALEPLPSVQVMSHTPAARERAKAASAPVAPGQAAAPAPVPVQRPSGKMTSAAIAPGVPMSLQGDLRLSDLRPPAAIPPARAAEQPRSRFDLPVVGDLARSARTKVETGLDNVSRGVKSLVGWR